MYTTDVYPGLEIKNEVQSQSDASYVFNRFTPELEKYILPTF